MSLDLQSPGRHTSGYVWGCLQRELTEEGRITLKWPVSLSDCEPRLSKRRVERKSRWMSAFTLPTSWHAHIWASCHGHHYEPFCHHPFSIVVVCTLKLWAKLSYLPRSYLSGIWSEQWEKQHIHFPISPFVLFISHNLGLPSHTGKMKSISEILWFSTLRF